MKRVPLMSRTTRTAGPKTIGTYRVVERLRRGSHGLAELFVVQSPSGELACLKRIPPSFGDDVDFVVRFTHEVELAQKLKHRSIVSVIDHGEDEGHYLVMELVAGAELGTPR